MNPTMEQAQGTAPLTAYCPRCGRAMLVAPEHLYVVVGCPHCSTRLEPWRLVAATHETPTMPYSAPRSPATPPMQAGYSMPTPLGYSWRNRWVAGALGVLLGGLGVHRFYLGFTGVGIVMIILGVLSLGVISGVWGFIEGILCFCGAMRDVDGRPLSG